jgi:enoyl-CoA hydratase/carnithine racemase
LASLTMRLNRAKSWMFQDSVLSATQADACGLVNSVVEPSELASAVASLARSATVMPLDGVTMSKMMLQAVLDAHGVGREFDMAGFYAVAYHERGGTSVGSVNR